MGWVLRLGWNEIGVGRVGWGKWGYGGKRVLVWRTPVPLPLNTIQCSQFPLPLSPPNPINVPNSLSPLPSNQINSIQINVPKPQPPPPIFNSILQFTSFIFNFSFSFPIFHLHFQFFILTSKSDFDLSTSFFISTFNSSFSILTSHFHTQF